MDTPATCVNCGTSATGRFCHHCGQKLAVERISWQWLLHQVPHVVWHYERGLLPTLAELYLRPGQLIRSYWRGVRGRTMNPLSLLLLLTAIVALNTALFAPPFESAMKISNPGIDPGRLQWQRFQWYFPLGVQAISLPLMSFGTWRCFYSFGQTYGEHVVMNVFITAAALPLSLPTAWLLAARASNSVNVYALASGLSAMTYMGYVWVVTLWPMRAADDTRFEMVMRCIGAFLSWAALQLGVTVTLVALFNQFGPATGT